MKDDQQRIVGSIAHESRKVIDEVTRRHPDWTRSGKCNRRFEALPAFRVIWPDTREKPFGVLMMPDIQWTQIESAAPKDLWKFAGDWNRSNGLAIDSDR